MTKIKRSLEQFVTLLQEKPRLLISMVFLGIFMIFFLKIDFSLIFTDSILTGGDSVSWQQIAEHLKNELIPRGRLFGWDLSNFFGYNNFQFYFIPPFLIAVLLSLVFPMTIAVKLATLLGIFTLPIAAYYTVKKITNDRWTGLIGAFLSMLFIFLENQNVFGGNFLSTLAGEFCYSYSLTIFMFFIGFCYDVFTNNKNPIWAGLLLGLIGLTHAFVFMIAVFIPIFFIFSEKIKKLKFTQDNKLPQQYTVPQIQNNRIFEKITLMYLTGFIVMAFWAIPMVFTKHFSQPILMTWSFQSFFKFLYKSMLPLTLAGFFLGIYNFTKLKNQRVVSIFFIYLFLLCFVLYFAANILKIPDIRFLPITILITIFPVCIFINNIDSYFPLSKIRNKKPRFLAALMIISIILIFTLPLKVSRWFKINYSGIESKKGYANLKKIRTKYSGSIKDGRILSEKIPGKMRAYFGSERIFENLMLLTGRPTTEGIHYGSSFMARPTLFLQSEYSPKMSGQETRTIFSKPNMNALPIRFYMLNAKDIIIHSSTMEHLFDKHSDFIKTGNFETFKVYTYKNFPASYIHITELSNLIILGKNKHGFKTQFHRFFRDYQLFPYPFIPQEFAGELKEKLKFINNYDSYKDRLINRLPKFNSWLSNYPYKNAVKEEKVDHFSIRFKTKYPGKPHIISITYAPNFKSKNGERIYPIAPGFMMIIPKSNSIHIYFDRSNLEIIGLIISLLFIPLILFRKKIGAWTLPPKLSSRLVALLKIGFSMGLIVLCITTIFLYENLESDFRTAYGHYNAYRYKKALSILNKVTSDINPEECKSAVEQQLFILKIHTLTKMGRTIEANKIKKLIPRLFLNHKMIYFF